jgi:hypothetical protein
LFKEGVMKRFVLLILLLSFFFSSISSAEIFQINNMRRGKEGLRARDKASGKDLWKSVIDVQKIKHEGNPYLYIKEEGAGIYGKDKKYKSWVSEAYYLFKDGRATPYQTKLIYKDREGKTLQTVTKIYDPETKKAVVQLNGDEKQFDFEEDLIDKELLGTALQNYPFDERRDVEFHLLTNEPTRYKITVKYRGKEKIKVGGEEIECHKLQMIPDLGLLNVFGAFVPKTYFWYKIDPPHDYVKYEGLESGLGTPYIILESSGKAEK